MEVLYPHCAGLDVHKDMVVACLRHAVNGKVDREVRTFKSKRRPAHTLFPVRDP
jgi:transposase